MRVYAVLCATTLLFAAACSAASLADGTGNSEGYKVANDSLTIQRPTTGALGVDSAWTFRAIRASGRSTLTEQLVWSSSNPAIATVGQSSGVVTGVAEGRAYIRVTASVGQDSTPVDVVSLKPFLVSPSSPLLQLGATTQLSTTSASPVTWTSTNGTIAQVSSTGVVTAVSVGSVSIAALNTANIKSSAQLTIVAPSSALPGTLRAVTMSPNSAALAVGATQQFTTAGMWSDGSTSAPVMTYIATGGTMSSAGLFTAGTTAGTFRVIANQQGGTLADTSDVIISSPIATLLSVVMLPATVTLAPGTTQQFSASGWWSDGSAPVPAVTYAATGGSISSGGLYTAGTTPGTFRVIVTQQNGTKADTSAVTILTPVATLVQLVTTPGTVSLAPLATQQFATSGMWSDGSTTIPAVTYFATGGTITSSGLYTASSTPGTYRVIAVQSMWSRADTSIITVTDVVTAPSNRWVSGYYVGYQRDLYPETSIDFTYLTHIIVGAIEPTANGSVTTDLWIDAITGPTVARTISTRAHQANRKALLMLGGQGYRTNLLAATSTANMPLFVNNLLAALTTLGYDGIDVDWEPLEVTDQPIVLDLLKRLRAARPNILLTMPVAWVNPNWQTVDPWFVQAGAQLDQMNIMSYQMADNWGGWSSWHSAALYGGAGDHPTSVSGSAAAYKTAGVPSAKIGIGLGFYGSCWRGTNDMRQTLLAGSGVVASDNTMSYTNILSKYFSTAAYKWDATARSGYLSYASATGPDGCTMVSYEDERSIGEKGAYVKANNFGGAIIWTIGQGHLPTAAAGLQDPLMAAAYNSIVR